MYGISPTEDKCAGQCLTIATACLSHESEKMLGSTFLQFCPTVKKTYPIFGCFVVKFLVVFAHYIQRYAVCPSNFCMITSAAFTFAKKFKKDMLFERKDNPSKESQPFDVMRLEQEYSKISLLQ